MFDSRVPPPPSSKVSGPMLVGGLFHRGLYHQPPSSVLGDITPYPVWIAT